MKVLIAAGRDGYSALSGGQGVRRAPRHGVRDRGLIAKHVFAMDGGGAS